MCEFDICLTSEEAGPVGRAMMRAEACLLREDADHVGPLANDLRSPEQRRAGALFAVVSDAAAALGLPPVNASLKSFGRRRPSDRPPPGPSH